MEPNVAIGCCEIDLLVAGDTEPKGLATSLERNVAEGRLVVLSCIGMPAVNQAMKAVAIAHGRVAPRGKGFATIPYFEVKRFRDKHTNEPIERTALRLRIVSVQLSPGPVDVVEGR